MKSARIAFGGVLLVAVLTITSGCGESESTARPAVDISKLDSGNYPTTPRTIERSEEQGAIQEALGLGEHARLPAGAHPGQRTGFADHLADQRRIPAADLDQ